MRSPCARTMVSSCLILLASAALTDEKPIDALITDLEAKAAHCESIGADDCARQCRGAAESINRRFVDRGLDYDSRTRPAIDHHYVNPCNMLADAAEPALTAPSMPDVEGIFQRAGPRGSFTVRAEGRDADWMEICRGATRINEPGGLARRPEGIRIRLVNITYDPERVGQQLTPCTAERVELLE